MNKDLKYPIVSVKIVFRCKDSVLYTITDGKIRDIPGGTVEFGEMLTEALKRELMEELGFNLQEEPRLLHVWTYISSDKSKHRVNIVFTTNLPSQINFTHKEDGDRTVFIWLPKDRIREQKFLPGMEKSLLKAVDDLL